MNRTAVTLVLLPGMDGTGALFGPFVAALGSEVSIKVVRYPTTGSLGYTELESIARAELPSDGPFVILGESFSGPIAVSLAASCPPRLKGLVLCCTFVRNPQPVFSALKWVFSLVPLASTLVLVLSHFLLGRFSTPALRVVLTEALAQVSPVALRARFNAILSVDASAKLSAVKVPVLYLRASQDRLVPKTASGVVSQFSPGTKVVQLEAPHFLLQAVPSEAARVVGSFVREVQET